MKTLDAKRGLWDLETSDSTSSRRTMAMKVYHTQQKFTSKPFDASANVVRIVASARRSKKKKREEKDGDDEITSNKSIHYFLVQDKYRMVAPRKRLTRERRRKKTVESTKNRKKLIQLAKRQTKQRHTQCRQTC